MVELFEQLQGEGEAGIRRLVDERAQENVTLDFKRKRDPAKGAFDKDDRAILAEVLSGFANSAGGLAIWGVDARKNQDGVDCAQDRVPIVGIERFQSEAQSLVGQLVLPRLEGVRLAHIKADDDPSAGYLLVRVERSERRPHRSEATGQKQYYKRAGDGFFVMEHYDIEDAFSRSTRPTVHLACELHCMREAQNHGPPIHKLSVDLIFCNTGGTLAKFPFLQIRNLKNLTYNKPFGTGSPSRTLIPSGQVDGWQSYLGGADTVIHPGHRNPVVQLSGNYFMGPGGAKLFGGQLSGEQHISFEARVGCEGAQSQVIQYSRTAEQIDRLVSWV